MQICAQNVKNKSKLPITTLQRKTKKDGCGVEMRGEYCTGVVLPETCAGGYMYRVLVALRCAVITTSVRYFDPDNIFIHHKKI